MSKTYVIVNVSKDMIVLKLTTPDGDDPIDQWFNGLIHDEINYFEMKPALTVFTLKSPGNLELVEQILQNHEYIKKGE